MFCESWHAECRGHFWKTSWPTTCGASHRLATAGSFTTFVKRKDVGPPSGSWNHRRSVPRELDLWRKHHCCRKSHWDMGGQERRNAPDSPLVFSSNLPALPGIGQPQQEASFHRHLKETQLARMPSPFHFSPQYREVRERASKGSAQWLINFEKCWVKREQLIS